MLDEMASYRKAIGSHRISNGLASRLFPQSNLHCIFNYYITERTLDFHGHSTPFTIINASMDDAINFMAMKDGDRLRFYFEFSDNVFTNNRFIERFLSISQQILSGEDQLSALSLVLPEEETEHQAESHKLSSRDDCGSS
jgi:hypothetical protein